MRALLLDPHGGFVVLRHESWEHATIVDTMGSADLVAREWPHPPPGRGFTCITVGARLQHDRGASLVGQGRVLVLGHDELGANRSLSRVDLYYLGAVIASEEFLRALPAGRGKRDP